MSLLALWGLMQGCTWPAQTKIKCWLFVSYVVAFAAVAGGVAVLVACVNKHHNLAIGIVRILTQILCMIDGNCLPLCM